MKAFTIILQISVLMKIFFWGFSLKRDDRNHLDWGPVEPRVFWALSNRESTLTLPCQRPSPLAEVKGKYLWLPNTKAWLFASHLRVSRCPAVARIEEQTFVKPLFRRLFKVLQLLIYLVKGPPKWPQRRNALEIDIIAAPNCVLQHISRALMGLVELIRGLHYLMIGVFI